MKYVFYIEESKYEDYYYQVNPAKGIELEVTMPLESMDSSYLQEMNLFTSMLGFDIKETKDSFIISGKLKAETASLMDLDFSEFDIELDVHDDGIYLLGDYYQKQ